MWVGDFIKVQTLTEPENTYLRAGDTLIMDEDRYSHNLEQPALFHFAEASTGMVELFPAVWGALEELVGPGNANRQSAVDRLVELGAPRLSPLVAYILATRISDPDVTFRRRIVQVLGEVLSTDEEGHTAPINVIRYINAYLAQMLTRTIFSLLEVAVLDSSMEFHVAKLLDACPYGGDHLASILSERKTSLVVRQKAAYMIGMVGFLDAIPILQRLEERLQARLSGQQAMPFAPPTNPAEAELLPTIRSALTLLHSL
jgi:hypothetical protein